MTGDERPNSPVDIGSQVIGGDVIKTVAILGSGTGSDKPNEINRPGDNDRMGHVRFFPLQQNRPGSSWPTTPFTSAGPRTATLPPTTGG